MVPCGFIFLFTPPGRLGILRRLAFPCWGSGSSRSPPFHLGVRFLLFLRWVVFGAWFSAAPGQGDSTGGTSRLRGFLSCGVKPSVGCACSRPPPPTRLGPASLGSPRPPRPASCSRRGSGRTLLLGRGLLPSPVPLCPLCPRATWAIGAAVLCPALMPSGLSLHTRAPVLGSAPLLGAVLFLQTTPGHPRPGALHSRPTSPGFQAQVGLGTWGLTGRGVWLCFGGLWRKCSSKQVSLSGTRAGVTVSMPPQPPLEVPPVAGTSLPQAWPLVPVF